MPYTTRDATRTLFGYLGLNETEVEFIPETSNRAFIFNLPNEDRCVIFIYPISRKVDNTKNFFDTRDSGARERGVQDRPMEYFHLFFVGKGRFDWDCKNENVSLPYYFAYV